MTKLLIDEPPLQVLPLLAKEIGLNEAIFIQQLHYWMVKSKHEHDERTWTYNTYEEWHDQFPFWSLRTMQRIVASLLEQKLIVVHQFTATDRDQKNWYSIEYKMLQALSDRITLDHAKLSSSTTTKRRHGVRQNGGMDSASLSLSDHANVASSSIKGSETTTETSSETTTEKPPFDGGEFLSTLERFERHRKEIKKPLKSAGREQLYDQLRTMGEGPAVAAMKKSMASGWQGVFPERNGNGSTQQRNGFESAAEKRGKQFNSHLAIIAELRGENSGDNRQVEGGESIAIKR